MRAPYTRWTAFSVALLAGLGVSGCGARGVSETANPADASTAELEALFRARTDSARMRFTEHDVRFMTDMIGHHAQAIVMAGMAPSHGASPSVQTLAARITNTQQDEIATMQQWLRDRGRPMPEVHAGAELIVHGADHAVRMPGMLTSEQMQELDRARGAEFDRLFLTYMIQHHEGAVVMVRELFAVDDAAQDEAVFRFASDIQADQETEIARMEILLQAFSARRGAR
jgi:uncharacterized protein (DUF305 family)